MKCKFILTFGSIIVFLLVLSPSLRADVLDHWTTNQVSTNYFGLRCVTYGNGRYVAAGGWSDWGVVLSSEDGKDWPLRSDGGGLSGSGLAFVESLVYGGGRFVAVGFWGGTAVSTNGTNWSFSNVNGNLYYGLSGVAYGANSYIAVGGWTGDDQNIFTSSDGITWTAQHSTSPDNGSLGDVAYGANQFVAIGINNGRINDSGHIYISDFGTDWSQQNIPGGSQISYCNGIFIVPFGNGTNLLSADGINWATQKTGLTNMLGKVTYANGLFLAGAGGHIATSTNGTNWIHYSQMLPGTSTIASDGNRLVTVGNNTYAFGPYSANGYTYCSDLLVGISPTNTPLGRVILSGLVGRSYRVEYTDALTAGTSNWKTNTTLQLPSSPYVWTDTTATNSQRFYRAVLLP